MTNPIRVPNGYLLVTTPSESTPSANNRKEVDSPGTAPTIIAWGDFYRANDVAVPEGFVDIDEAVASLEADPVRRESLAKARQRIAQVMGGEHRGLAYLRLRQGWSQKTLADAIGTSQPHIARIEAGRGDVFLGTANNLARVLGVSILEINEALGFGEPQT